MNYKIFKLMSSEFDGIIIVPMTLVNPDYYEEIIVKLIDDGVDVRHFILYANRETILKRLKFRSAGMIGRERFAVNAIDRCLYSFDNYIKDVKIITDNKNIKDITDEIAKKNGIPLLPDNRSKIKKLLDRYFALIRHIRQ